MLIESPYLVKPGKSVKLSDWPTDDTGSFKDRDDAEKATVKDLKQLEDLQEVLYAQNKHALLVVFQAMDGGGKDGAIKHVFGGVNPQGCSVTSFKVPSSLEARHDFLWRIHQAVPPRGIIGIFNRSHYESVLVERVHSLVPKSVWKNRYEQINQFEQMLTDEGTLILKFFLHISKKEQKQRMQARLDDAQKNWKFSADDLKERAFWDDYQAAYADAVSKCSTDAAPWYCVPADHKWFRNWVIGDVIVRALRSLKMNYPEPMKGIEKIKVE